MKTFRWASKKHSMLRKSSYYSRKFAQSLAGAYNQEQDAGGVSFIHHSCDPRLDHEGRPRRRCDPHPSFAWPKVWQVRPRRKEVMIENDCRAIVYVWLAHSIPHPKWMLVTPFLSICTGIGDAVLPQLLVATNHRLGNPLINASTFLQLGVKAFCFSIAFK